MNATITTPEVKTNTAFSPTAPGVDAVVELSAAQLVLVGGGSGSISLE